MDVKQVKKVTANSVAIIIIILFGIILFIGEPELTVLQGGDIQHAIDTAQDK
jgi:type IV secretory pathway VirB2 component (pilin)